MLFPTFVLLLSGRGRHPSGALVSGVQTCGLPIFPAVPELLSRAIRSLQERRKPLPQDLPMHPAHRRGEGDLLAARLGLALERLPVTLRGCRIREQLER